VYSGAGEVANAMLVVGWWLLPITAYHIVPMLFSALSWRELLPPATRPDVVSVTWIRWVRESINSLLPVANIGGDIASARLAHLRGVPGPQAAASMVVDTTVGVVTQMAFVIAGGCAAGIATHRWCRIRGGGWSVDWGRRACRGRCGIRPVST
jgi:hypothetical protein